MNRTRKWEWQREYGFTLSSLVFSNAHEQEELLYYEFTMQDEDGSHGHTFRVYPHELPGFMSAARSMETDYHSKGRDRRDVVKDADPEE